LSELSIDYQIVLFNLPTSTVERTLLWLEKAAQLTAQNRDLKFTVRVGDCSPMQITGDDIWATWKQRFASSFDLHYEFFAENLGHGGAQNRLAASGSSDYIIFANPDILVMSDAFNALLEVFDAVPNLAAADAKQIPFEHPKDYDKLSGETAWCSGAFMMVLRKAFNEVGGFDHETFYMHGDDVDLSWRLKLAGYQIRHQPAAVVNHTKLLTSSTRISSTTTELIYSAQCALLLAYKWSRADILENLWKALSKSDEEAHQMAIAHFETLKKANKLPKRLDPQRTVGVFENGNYSPHRWS
jgi:GT2 family glycosyltransferase